MRLELSSYVEGDLQEIAEWIAQDNPRRAVSFIREIPMCFARLAKGRCSINCGLRSERMRGWLLWDAM